MLKESETQAVDSMQLYPVSMQHQQLFFQLGNLLKDLARGCRIEVFELTNGIRATAEGDVEDEGRRTFFIAYYPNQRS